MNIMLSVAENEADRTSERIKFVFKGKLQRGEYCYGGAATPFGYKPEMIDGLRRLVRDPETEPATAAFWDKLQKYRNIRQAGREVNLEYGLGRAHKSWMAMARNEIYTGDFKGIKGFCSPYISRAAWEELQHPERMVKSAQGDRTYLFAGLIRCPVCGCTLKSNYKTYPNDRSKEYYSYRCGNKSLGHCTYSRQLSERKLEKYMLQNIQAHLEQYAISTSARAPKNKPPRKKIDVGKLREQLRRLNNIYISGNMSDSEYNAQAEVLRSAIAEAERKELSEPRAVDLDAMRSLIGRDFAAHYADLTRQERQRLWRSIVQEIRLDDNQVCEIVFKA